MPDTPQQTELPLEAPPLPEDAPFLPARMVNEYVYCPRLAKKAETITITEEDGPTTTARLIDVSQVVLMGNVRMTTPCLHELMRREIPVTWHSGHRFRPPIFAREQDMCSSSRHDGYTRNDGMH